MQSDTLDNSIAALAQKIKEVEADISKAEIRAEKAEAEGNTEGLNYWRSKELQLRDKELLLLRRETARREELQQDVGISSDGDYEDRLCHLPSAQRVASLYGDLQEADPKYDEKDYLFNMHRPADAQGLPAALASPIFGAFLDKFNGKRHLDSGVCRLALGLTTMLSACYKNTNTAEALSTSRKVFGEDYQGVSRGGELTYSQRLIRLLTELLHNQLGGLHPIVPSPVSEGNREETDGSIVVTDAAGRDLAHVLIMEMKHEWGAGGGSNPQVHALAYYARTASRRLKSQVLRETVYPALLLEAFSNGLRLSAAYFTDKVCCEPLTPHLHFSDLRDGQPQYMEQLGRFLQAFATAVKQTEDFYDGYKGSDGQSRTRKLTEKQMQAAGSRNRQSFNIPYMLRDAARGYSLVEPTLGGRYTYLCTKPSGEQTVCKITLVPYPEELHKELAATERKLAPAFFGQTEHPGGVHVIEMEYLSGSQGWMPLSQYTGDWQALKPMAEEALRGLQKCLGNMAVHGDLRPPNIMIRLEGDAVKELRFIDLASAGKNGEARYPLFLNREIAWPCESPDGQPIYQKHDEKLLFDSLSVGRQVISDRGKQQMPIRAGMAQMRFQSHRRPRMWLQLRPKPVVRASIAL